MTSFTNSILPIIGLLLTIGAVVIHVPIIGFTIHRTITLNPIRGLQFLGFALNLFLLFIVVFICLFIITKESLENFESKEWRPIFTSFILLIYPGSMMCLWQSLWMRKWATIYQSKERRTRPAKTIFTQLVSFIALTTQTILFFVTSFILPPDCEIHAVETLSKGSCSKVTSCALIGCFIVQLGCFFVDRCLIIFIDIQSMKINRVFVFSEVLIISTCQVSET